MHAIPTWGYLYRAVIPILVGAGYRGNAPHFTLRAAAHYGFERELELRAAARPPTHRQAAE